MSKYFLTKLIDSLTKEEIRNFKIYVKRLKTKGDSSKNELLFNLIKYKHADEFSDKIVENLFEGNNKNAYYRLKNRLINDIENSLLILNIEKDDRFEILNQIQLSNIYKYKSNYDLAYHYLLKAEEKAIKGKYQDLLNLIFEEIILLSVNYYKIDPEIYIKKKEENFLDQKEQNRVNYLLRILNYKMRRSNWNYQEEDLKYELNHIIQKLEIDEDLSSDFETQLQIYQAVRTNLLVQKDFEGLERYLLNTYERFTKMKFFEGKFFERVFVLLNWLINVSIINLNFEQSAKYSELLNKQLHKYNKKFYYKYVWMYHQGFVITQSFLGSNEEVLQLLEEIKANKELKGNNFYDLYVNLNLAISYFNKNEIEPALQNVFEIKQSDPFQETARHIQLSICIVEIILHFENEDFNYTDHLIKECKRKYRKELITEKFSRQKSFLTLMSKLLRNATPFKSKNTVNKIQEFLRDSPQFEPGSSEAINYKMYLESRLFNLPYYSHVLKAVGTIASNKQKN